MLKKIIQISALTTIVFCGGIGTTFGSSVTTKAYVDTAVDTKQPKIPAAGTSGVGAGTSVVTYTDVAGGGVIGERALYTDASSYTAATDADKLITGAALNGAFTSLPTTETSKLTCQNSPACTLWTISTQTAYGNSDGGNGGVSIDLNALIGNSAGVGYGYTQDTSADQGPYNQNDEFEEGLYGLPSVRGNAFAVEYGSNRILKGNGFCSQEAGRGVYDAYDWDVNYYPAATTSSEFTMTTSLTRNNLGNRNNNCWCQLSSYASGGTENSLSGLWVFLYPADDAEYCDWDCAKNCAEYLLGTDTSKLRFRTAMFNSVQ